MKAQNSCYGAQEKRERMQSAQAASQQVISGFHFYFMGSSALLILVSILLMMKKRVRPIAIDDFGGRETLATEHLCNLVHVIIPIGLFLSGVFSFIYAAFVQPTQASVATYTLTYTMTMIGIAALTSILSYIYMKRILTS